MLLSPLPNRWRMRPAILVLSLLLAVAAAIVTQPSNVQVGATTPESEEPAVQLTCQAVGPLIGCALLSPRELDEDEGVSFIFANGGETQTIVATRETNPVFRSSASCGESDRPCYVFSFTPADADGEFTISEVTLIRAGLSQPTSTDDAPASDDAQQLQPDAPAATPTHVDAAQTQPPGQAPDAVTADTTPVQVETTDDVGETPQLSPEEIARRQREHEQIMAKAQQEQDEVNAEIRRRQDEGDWPERDPDAPEDELSDAELEAELAVHEELHQQRQEREAAERENRFPSQPGDDSDTIVLDFPTEDADGNLAPGAFQEWVVELHELIESGQPFLVCDHNEVGQDGGPLCTWENQ